MRVRPSHSDQKSTRTRHVRRAFVLLNLASSETSQRKCTLLPEMTIRLAGSSFGSRESGEILRLLMRWRTRGNFCVLSAVFYG